MNTDTLNRRLAVKNSGHWDDSASTGANFQYTARQDINKVVVACVKSYNPLVSLFKIISSRDSQFPLHQLSLRSRIQALPDVSYRLCYSSDASLRIDDINTPRRSPRCPSRCLLHLVRPLKLALKVTTPTFQPQHPSLLMAPRKTLYKMIAMKLLLQLMMTRAIFQPQHLPS